MRSSQWPTLSIRYTLPIIFALLIAATVGLIGWLAYRSGLQSIDDLATWSRREAAARIEEHTSAYLATPNVFHQINDAAVRTGTLDPGNLIGMEGYLWEQVQVTDAVPFVYFGTEQGEILGVERRADGTPALWTVLKAEGPDLNVYQLDDKLNRVKKLDNVPGFDPRGRPWYTAAVQVGGATWSAIYPDISRPILVITSVMPVYDQAGKLVGVWGIDLPLDQITNFMRSLEIGQTGQAFIVERTGKIVASSADEPPTVTTENGQERLAAVDSKEPMISAVAQYLQNQPGGLEGIQDNQQFTLPLDGVRHFVEVKPLQDGRGLDWLIVVVIPETDFIGPIYAGLRSTVVLGLVILLVASLLGFLIARWIIRPIIAVTDAAASVEASEFTLKSLEPVVNRTDELGVLARVFQRMAEEVYAREQSLKRQLQQLRIEIDEVKRQKQVSEIADSDFFRELQAKARDMRDRQKSPEEDDEEKGRD